MRRDGAAWVFSPTDLVTFFGSPWAAWHERLLAQRPGAADPDPVEPGSATLAARGAAHEQAVLRRFEGRLGPAVRIAPGPGAAAATAAAMARGAPLIAQAALAHGAWAGYADLVVSDADGLTVWDAKLARSVRPRDLVQLGAYALLVERGTGRRVQRLGVALGDGREASFRADDVTFHTRAVERAFLEAQAAFDPGAPPEPEPGADHGRWSGAAQRWFERRDHLALVAGVSRAQIARLTQAGLGTLTALAGAAGATVPGIRPPTFEALREQAALQLQARRSGTLPWRVVPPTPEDPRRGLARLPPPSPGDVVLDLEGNPLVEGGLEYLFGAVALERGSPRYRAWWAHDPDAERRALEGFLAWVVARRRRHPGLHVYHYAAYEVTALKRLAGRTGAGEEALDGLLRGSVFVDLYPVVHQGLRIGAPSYSIKQVERLWRGAREEAVASGLSSIEAYERWEQSGEPADPARSPLLESLRAYNEADCRSTWDLVAWLRERQAEAGIAHVPPPSTEPAEGAPPSPLSEENARRQALAATLLAEIPADPVERAREAARWEVQELLAQLLEFHRREDKPAWWAHFERLSLSPDDLVDDPDSIGRLTRSRRPVEGVRRSKGVWYAFEAEQETRLSAGDRALLVCGGAWAEVGLERLDDRGEVLLSMGPAALTRLGGQPPPHGALVPVGPLRTEGLRAAIERVALAWRAGEGLPPPLHTLLHREGPRLRAGATLPDGGALSDPVGAAVATARALDGTTLCVQGPPGTGKTYVGARLIAALLADGRNVGIAAHAHKAIHHLLAAVAEAVGRGFTALKAGAGGDEGFVQRCKGLRVVEGSREAAEAYAGGLVAGTAWLFAQPALAGRLDALVVDEAGQLSLANVVAMAGSARNLVLLGDPMQLAQPTQGTHPGGSGASALVHLLGGHATIPPGRGLFLATTRRLHPEVCRVVSGLAYEDRLVPHRSTAGRVVRLPRRLPARARVRVEAGVVFVPVEHDGGPESSPEEVEEVARLLEELQGRALTDEGGAPAGTLGPEDVLVVAPYNLQVKALQRALGARVRVGTVDRFQGQEAAVVILSLTASAADAGPRGLEFVLDRNRLNVALSRARSLAVVVGDPRLARAPCRSVAALLQVNLAARLMSPPS